MPSFDVDKPLGISCSPFPQVCYPNRPFRFHFTLFILYPTRKLSVRQISTFRGSPSDSPSRMDQDRGRSRSSRPSRHSRHPSESSSIPRSQSRGQRDHRSRTRSRSFSRGRTPSRSRARGPYRQNRSYSRSLSRTSSPPKSSKVSIHCNSVNLASVYIEIKLTRPSNKIVVEKLTKNVTENHVREIFGGFGEIEYLDVPMNKACKA